MKNKFKLITFFLCIGALNLEAAKAVCTCSGNKRPPDVEIALSQDPKPVCKKECENIGLRLVKAQRR